MRKYYLSYEWEKLIILFNVKLVTWLILPSILLLCITGCSEIPVESSSPVFDPPDITYRAISGGGTPTYFVGDSGTIILSEGRYPIVASTNTNVTLRGIIWLGSAVGDNGTVLVTSDFGHSWISKPSPTHMILNEVNSEAWYGVDTVIGNDTVFAGGKWIMAVGDSGTIIYTRDKDSSWIIQQSGTSENLLDLKHVGSFVTAVGTNGTIIRSDNRGATWSQVPSGTTADLFYINGDIKFRNPNVHQDVFIFGRDGTILQATISDLDAINISSWSMGINENLTAAYTYIDEESKNRIFLSATDDGRILRSEGNGKTWQKVFQSAVDTINAIGPGFIEQHAMFAVGTRGLFLFSIDDGLSWRTYP